MQGHHHTTNKEIPKCQTKITALGISKNPTGYKELIL